uniref:GH18 domain-containing protein n=1 Tax=Thermogemmatispora argillosa TaxID=2045280 RepID=A0A455SUA3_9CHLR|nr:hypothetical protein KTA_01560 [Thermogemmatispora argillosa]
MQQRKRGVLTGFLLIALAIILTLLMGAVRARAPLSFLWTGSDVTLQQQNQSTVQSLPLLNGKLASLGWIVGRDCQRGIQAYLQTADINPDAALVGSGWVNPLTGQLMNGESNNCQAGTLSMENVVRLIHSKGGKAYLTVTMETDANGWTARQQSDYIKTATQQPAYIQAIVNVVKQGSYDGVIMDLEGADRTYPQIQQLFADYNRLVWKAMQAINKPYGIALIHKVADRDDYYNLNGFEDWSLLGHCADFLVIMSLDQSYFTPGPTVSVPWLKQILAYALKTMPQMLPRIVWEFPLYGAGWHQAADGHWIFDGGINYADAVALVKSIPANQIDQQASNLNDPYAAHLVYTDSNGVRHAIWYHTAANLLRIIREFRAILQQTPQFSSAHAYLQIAVWYRATWEPGTLWRALLPVLPNGAA